MAKNPWVVRVFGLVRLIRPQQWIKNGLVGAAAIFGGKIFDLEVMARVGLGFLAFCALSGAVYAWNDLHDRAEDRLHPTKRHRPLASGLVPPNWALALSAILAGAGGLGLAAVDPSGISLGLGLAYLGLSALYTLWAKDQVILDVLVVAGGFLLRVMAGGALAGVKLSPWLLACTLLLALTLSVGKRRGELMALEAGATQHRPVMSHYPAPFLDQMIAVIGATTIICYILYTLLSETGQRKPYLFGSALPVVYGVLRYFYIIYHRKGGEAPETLLVNDRPLLAAVFVWLIVVGVALYT
jgi:4-hydroxybenzoate polyprenyltransferase